MITGRHATRINYLRRVRQSLATIHKQIEHESAGNTLLNVITEIDQAIEHVSKDFGHFLLQTSQIEDD